MTSKPDLKRVTKSSVFQGEFQHQQQQQDHEHEHGQQQLVQQQQREQQQALTRNMLMNIILRPGPNVIKLFASVIQECS
jgi:hypothetical protein